MEKYQFNEIEFSHMEASPIPFAVYQFIDKRVVTLVLSEGFRRLFGYEHEEAYRLMDHDMYRDTHHDDVSRIADEAFRFATEGGSYDVVYRTKVDQGYRIIHAQGEHVYADDGTRLAYVWYTDEGPYFAGEGLFEAEVRKTLSNKLREESLRHRSYYDLLTGLPNMTYFFELAEAGRLAMLERGERPALLFFNLSGMKHFNHRYGFSEGDRLIKAMARILVRHFSNENCSRFGKDQFAVFTDAEGLDDTLQDIFDECEDMNGGRNLPVRVGIYLDEIEEVDVGEACDRAQYACSLIGDSYVSEYHRFESSMLAIIENKQYIIDNLDKALEEQWIKVYYQAIVRSANSLVCDEEALARWIDPEKGLLSPAEFIPILEEARLIYKLDLYVIEQVLAKMKRQADEGLYVVPQSINLSRTDFDAIDIVEEIRWRVDAAKIDRSKLTIEITESVVGSDFEFMKGQIERFQELGFKVWMDDFGSGYSSLDVLQKIHFDLIKLDMHFLEGFGSNDGSKIILTELVKMAIGLGIDTVAEGVETAEQAAFLKEIGCSRLQGFYYTKPIPPEEIVERNRLGIQIGFENPEEADYYATLGKVNLYDMAVLAQEDDQSLERYFDTMPMAIFEVSGSDCHITRTNISYRDYMKRAFGITSFDEDLGLSLFKQKAGTNSLFLDALMQCAQDGNLVVLDEDVVNGETTHALIKRIAVNPVTGTAALVVAVLAVIDRETSRAAVNYAHIAKALSSDYQYLYYVDLETEDFVEYSSSGASGDLSIERHGTSFFEASRRDALSVIYEPDQKKFVEAFTKENVVSNIDKRGSFITTYRQYVGDEPRYMIMKGVRMSASNTHVIIGVNDIDDRMKEREALERIKQDQIAYTRINALSDDYLCIYIVNLETEHFEEYGSTNAYQGLGLAQEGEDFFAQSDANKAHAIHKDDLEKMTAVFTKENVVNTIRRDGSFTVDYRLLMDGKPTPVSMKAVIVEEADGDRLIIGIR